MRRAVVISLLVVASAGCASVTHLTKEKALPPGATTAKVIVVDAKQRAIVGAVVDKNLRVCAEPSPDALSALAASAGLSLSKADVVQLASNLSVAEGAASIGLRTQSIQLMRDAMFRLCEAYVSNAIDDLAFQTLQRRFQSSMVAILAIEQLTGATRAPAVVLSGAASEGSAEKAAELTEKTETARAALRKSEGAVTEKEDASKKATAAREALEKEQAELKKKEMPDDKDKARLAELPDLITKAKASEKDAASALADAKTSKDEKEASLKALDEARQVALAGGGQASVKGTVADLAAGARDTGATAAAVQAIVQSTLNLEFGRELCTTILLKVSITNDTHTKCLAYLDQSINALQQYNNSLNSFTPELVKLIAALTAAMNNPTTDAEKTKAAAAALDAALKMWNPQTGANNLVPKPPVLLVQ